MPALGVVGSKWIEPLDLAQTGTYTIKIDPQSFAKGSQTLTAWTFHGDQTANTSADGSTHTFNLATPGQNGSLYVSASNGDRLSFTFTGVANSPGKMWIKNPDGTVLVPTQTLSGRRRHGRADRRRPDRRLPRLPESPDRRPPAR